MQKFLLPPVPREDRRQLSEWTLHRSRPALPASRPVHKSGSPASIRISSQGNWCPDASSSPAGTDYIRTGASPILATSLSLRPVSGRNGIPAPLAVLFPSSPFPGGSGDPPLLVVSLPRPVYLFIQQSRTCRKSDYMNTKIIIKLWPKLSWCQVNMFTPLCQNKNVVRDNL